MVLHPDLTVRATSKKAWAREGDQRTSQGSDSLFWWEPKPEDPDVWPRPAACCQLCFYWPALKDLLVLVQVALRLKGISLWPHIGSCHNFPRYCRHSKRKIFILWGFFLHFLLLVFPQQFQVGQFFFFREQCQIFVQSNKGDLIRTVCHGPNTNFSS